MAQFMIDDEMFAESLDVPGGFVSAEGLGFMLARNAPPAGATSDFHYGRMFRRPDLPPHRPERAGLIELGLNMRESADPGLNLSLPAGYVYLGQFIDHDLSFNAKTNNLPTEFGEPEDELSLRSPALDLDSLYGFDPAALKQSPLGQRIYADDGIRLRVGDTRGDKDGGVGQVFPNDLPRNGDPAKQEAAAIVDPRNDENLAVAQTHLSFVKFHNAVVERLSGKLSGVALFEAAREQVVRHYQWIILRDYLPRVIEPAVLKDVIEHGCQHLVFAADEQPFVPFEFAMAAFRFGHSLVKPTYQWNKVFQSKPHGLSAAALIDLFTFTGFGQQALFNRVRLLSTWIIDWTRFYDFAGFPGVENNPRSNQARKITPSLVAALTKLPPFSKDEEETMGSLPMRNLLRGRTLGVPSGHSVAARLGVPELTADEVKEQADPARREILERHGFDRETPLWYYILKEAEKRHEGERLGPVGSRIMAETFVALIKRSEFSILPREATGEPVWQPDLGIRPGEFSMPDLLYFVHKGFGNHLNPLGT
ncbi:MAG TPA: heme peroxidase family protein [Pyrinomonadaceae bacterium]|nr:heme peroxidase family protein [Pyrinomonadaceae bacterium]